MGTSEWPGSSGFLRAPAAAKAGQTQTSQQQGEGVRLGDGAEQGVGDESTVQSGWLALGRDGKVGLHSIEGNRAVVRREEGDAVRQLAGGGGASRLAEAGDGTDEKVRGAAGSRFDRRKGGTTENQCERSEIDGGGDGENLVEQDRGVDNIAIGDGDGVATIEPRERQNPLVIVGVSDFLAGEVSLADRPGQIQDDRGGARRHRTDDEKREHG